MTFNYSIALDHTLVNQELRTLPRPEPSAGLDAYERERQLCLNASFEKHENYIKYIASARRDSVVDYLPIKLDIENVSRCNYRCTMCAVSDWHKGTRGADMSVEDFKAIIDEQIGLVEIKLQGLGEPLMQGDDFFEMIKYARARHIWVRTTTNTSLLHLRNNAQKLVDARPNEIQVSVDGATKETFEKIRRGSHFETVKKNCRILNDYCKTSNVRLTKMWTVVQRVNRHEMEDLVRLAHELGFQDQTFAFSLTDWGSEKWRDQNNAVTVEDQLSQEEAWKLVELGESLGIRVSFWNTTSKYSTESRENLCPWPFERAVITSDLRTVPCCTIGNPDHYEVGPNSGKSFNELWLADEYREFRQAHLDGEIPNVCKGCYKAS